MGRLSSTFVRIPFLALLLKTATASSISSVSTTNAGGLEVSTTNAGGLER